MENILPFTLFGSGVAFGIVAVLLFIVLISADANESGGFALIALLIAIGLNYFWGTFPILSFITVRNVLAYLFIGFLFSLVRTYFKGKKLKPEEKKYFDLKDHVFRWWLLFPISALTWLFGDLLQDLFKFAYSKLDKLYQALFTA